MSFPDANGLRKCHTKTADDRRQKALRDIRLRKASAAALPSFGETSRRDESTVATFRVFVA